MRHFLSELKLAMRTWSHRPGLALAAVVTPSLGLGSATAIWSLLQAVLIAPLPYAEGARRGGLQPMERLREDLGQPGGDARFERRGVVHRRRGLLVFAVLPDFGLAKARLLDGLSRASRRTGGSPRQRFVRRGLVAAQLAFAVLLCVGGLLIAVTVRELGSIDIGFKPDGVLTARVSLPAATQPDAEKTTAYHTRLLDGVRALPDVKAAGLLRNLPLGESIGDFGVQVEGPNGQEHGQADWQASSDGTIETLGLRLLAGRDFLPSDIATAPQVALINEAMARRYWPGLDPVRVTSSLRALTQRLDPVVFIASGAFLLLVAAVGAALPARRACGIDPAEALRDE